MFSRPEQAMTSDMLHGVIALIATAVDETAEFFLPPFLITWLVGLLLTALAFWLTRNASPIKRIALLSFLLAATVTPSIVLQHTTGILPAILVLVTSPFVPMYGWTYSLLFGL